jgi:hypothetical protein
MMAQIREASAATELAEMKQQITELETAVSLLSTLRLVYRRGI